MPTLNAVELPDGLTDKSWWAAPNVAGTLTRGRTLTLPTAEDPRAVSDGRIASALFGIDNGIGTPISVTFKVREISSGRVVAEAEMRQGADTHVALGSEALFFVGYANPPSGGLYALSVIDSSLVTLIPPDGLPRGALVLSTSGNTLALFAGEEWLAEIVNVRSGLVRTHPLTGIPFLVTDTQVFTRGLDTLSAVDIATGTTLWEIRDTVISAGYATSDGKKLVVQTGFDRSETSPAGVLLSQEAVEPAIVVIEATTGARRVLLNRVELGSASLWVDVSNDENAVLARDMQTGIPSKGDAGPIRLTLVELATGRIRKDAFAITP